MTTSPPDPASWAARQVGLSPDAPPDVVRGALLREVTRADFVPPPERHAAWQAVCAPPGTPPPEMLLAEESRLRGEVDDFAAAFFATPVAARQQRWQALSAQCAFSPPLTARLAALQPALGLELRLEDVGNPRTAQLASHVAGLFVLAPVARAAQRQAVLRSLQADIAGWEEMTRQLQAVAPALAALEPTLLSSILGWRVQQQRLSRARAGREPPSRPAPRTAARAKAAAPPAPAAKGSGGGRAVGWGAVVLVGLAIRVCAGIGSHTSPAPNVPEFHPELFQAPQQIDPRVFDDLDRLQRLNQQFEDDNRRQKEADDPFQQMPENNNGVQPGEAKPLRPEEFVPHERVPRPPPRDKPLGPDTRRER
jgi:hypothetical protein